MFDHYDLPISLKAATWQRCQGDRAATVYRVEDNTPVGKVFAKTVWINRQERLQSRNELMRETKRHESSYKSSRVRQNERSNNVIKNGYNKARAMTFG